MIAMFIGKIVSLTLLGTVAYIKADSAVLLDSAKKNFTLCCDMCSREIID